MAASQQEQEKPAIPWRRVRQLFETGGLKDDDQVVRIHWDAESPEPSIQRDRERPELVEIW